MAAALVVGAGSVWGASGAAWTAPVTDTGNAWSGGQVSLTVSSASAVFAVAGINLMPGSAGVNCVSATYAGNVLAAVRLYESAESGAFAQYVQLTITMADGSGAADCSNFATLANPVILTTSSDLVWLSSFAGTYATGLGNWSASATTTKTYQFAYTVSNSTPSSAQNTTASATFTWEAQT